MLRDGLENGIHNDGVLYLPGIGEDRALKACRAVSRDPMDFHFRRRRILYSQSCQFFGRLHIFFPLLVANEVGLTGGNAWSQLTFLLSTLQQNISRPIGYGSSTSHTLSRDGSTVIWGDCYVS